jgi:tripartite-type tricarboxylate transporter receptor subunit TctC
VDRSDREQLEKIMLGDITGSDRGLEVEPAGRGVSRRLFLAASGGAVASSVVGTARASDYPTRPVQLVVGWPAGGGADLVARFVAQELSSHLSQPFVVMNRGGAAGLIASYAVSAAKPDGHTLLFTTVAEALLPYITPDLKLDVLKDLTPITMVGYSPYIMAVHPRIPVSTPIELVNWIKQNPNDFRWAVAGIADPGYYATLQFNKMAGINAPLINYTGGLGMATGTIGDQVQGLMLAVASLKPFVMSGQLRALGVGTLKPTDLVADLRPIASYGFPNFEIANWYGIWGPKDMPSQLADQIHDEVEKIMRAPELVERLHTAGVSVKVSKNAAEFAQYFKSQVEFYGVMSRDVAKQ